MKKYINIIILLITFFIEIIFIYNIFKINILPTKYTLIIISILILIYLIIIYTITRKKIIPKIISILLILIITIPSIIGTIYINDTVSFLNKAFNNNKIEITTYKLIVLNNDKYNNVEDLKNKKITYLKLDEKENNIIEELKEKINPELEQSEDLFEAYDNLLNKKTDALLLDQGFIEELHEEDKNLYDKIKIIETYNIEEQIEIIEEEISLRPINIFISGSDSRSNTIYNKSRSDVNMILTINPNTRKILITSIPRDYYVQVHGQTGLKDKLTHAGIYGLDISEQTLEDLFDIKIDYSIKVNFNAVVEVVDLVGGIDIYSDITFNSYHKKGWVVQKGINHMDGEKALAYSRERYAYVGGDRHRIQNQQQVLEAVLKKIISNKKLLLQYDELLDSLSNLYRTTIPKELITIFVKDQIDNMDSWSFESIRVDGKNAMLPTYTAKNTKRYVMIPYEDDIKMAHDKINETIKK